MKQSKDTVFEFIQKMIYTHEKYSGGLETNVVAQALNMQRSNVSTILNKLVKEEKLIKTKTRPVLYQLSNSSFVANERSCFTQLIGNNGSLQNAILLAKAAILYPKKSLNVLVSGKSGCGFNSFVSLMHQFAIESGIFKKNAPFIKINCRYFSKNISALNDELFNNTNNVFEQARGGTLFIAYFDLLDVKQQNQIFNFLDTHFITNSKGETKSYPDVYLVLSCLSQNVEVFNHKLPVQIELPELKERPLQERLDLINHFFSIEAQNSKRQIEVTTESIKALLLSDFQNNVRDLSREIISACANAYVRVIHDLNKCVYVCANDFAPKVRRSLLKLKDHTKEIDALFGNLEYLTYDKIHGIQSITNEKNLYNSIQNQYEELSNRGVNQASIETVINNHIKNLFNQYSYKYENEAANYEQLAKIVDKNIISQVSDFLNKYFIDHQTHLAC